MKYKRLLILLAVIGMVGILTGCSKGNKDLKEKASEIIDVFSSGDISTINQFMLAPNEIEMDEELADEFGFANEEEQKQGVLAQIFQRDTIHLKSVDDKHVTYKVTAPHMSDLFTKIQEEQGKLTEDNLTKYISDYVKNAKLTETTVKVSYTMKDGIFIADYKSEEFLNAITGGFLQNYKDMYQDILEDYRKGLGE